MCFACALKIANQQPSALARWKLKLRVYWAVLVGAS
jgi:hypothetical protein